MLPPSRLEYFIFHLVVIAGPLCLSFEHRIQYVKKWSIAAAAAAIAGVPYLIWDLLVTGKHWNFNPNYILGLKFWKLPIEEYLYFITIPWACLFIWENILFYQKRKEIASGKRIYHIFPGIFFICGIISLVLNKEYTAYALFSLGLSLFLDKQLGISLWKLNHTYLYLGFIVLSIFIFDGYLTARPIVTYGETFYSGLRVITIPIEDFIYGTGQLLLVTAVYEKLKKLSE